MISPAQLYTYTFQKYPRDCPEMFLIFMFSKFFKFMGRRKYVEQVKFINIFIYSM